MAVLTVLEYPDLRLRNKAKNVTEFDKNLHAIVDDMFETMYKEEGVGLAAIQVGIEQRIIVMDISEDKKKPLCIINPEILHREGTQYEYEGCLSFPGAYERVERAATVKVRAQDKYGKFYEIEATDLFAICIQHETDHLNGILFVDHLTRLRQDRLRTKLIKSRRKAS